MQYRTHTCNELRLEDAGKNVRLSGWVENVREVSGNLAFVVLRDFYGTTQLVLENRPMEDLEEVLDFCYAVGLPVTLEQLGVEDVTEEKIMAVAEASCAEGETIFNMPFEVNADSVYAAIMAADAIGQSYLMED